MKENFEKILGRLSDILNILDFSYIISGSVATMTLYWILFNSTPGFCAGIAHLDTTALTCCFLIVAYTLGHVVGALGRGFRFMFKWGVRVKFFQCFFYYDMLKVWNSMVEDLHFEQCDDVNLKCVCQKIDGVGSLSRCDYVKKTDDEVKQRYAYLWNYLSSKESAQHRLSHINRFWGMQKMYEGLMMDALVACVATFSMSMTECIDVAFWPMIVIMCCFLIAFFTCCYEANKCAKTQFEELLSACRIY